MNAVAPTVRGKGGDAARGQPCRGEGDERNRKQIGEVGEGQHVRQRLRGPEHVVVVEPDDGDDKITDGIACRFWPKIKERTQIVAGGRSQIEHHHRDDHRENPIR
jgi:hypothetical protein